MIMIEVKRNDLVYMHSTAHDYARNRENSNLAKDFLTKKKVIENFSRWVGRDNDGGGAKRIGRGF